MILHINKEPAASILDVLDLEKKSVLQMGQLGSFDTFSQFLLLVDKKVRWGLGDSCKIVTLSEEKDIWIESQIQMENGFLLKCRNTA